MFSKASDIPRMNRKLCKKICVIGLIQIIPKAIGKELTVRVKLSAIVQENPVNLNQNVCQEN